MDIGKFKDNYNKDRKPRYFNCNIYGHMAKNFQKLKKEKETRKCYKYDKVGYFTKNCRLEQKMKNRSIQKESDKEDNNKEKCFVGDLEQIWYDKPLYIINLLINMLSYIGETTKRGNSMCI